MNTRRELLALGLVIPTWAQPHTSLASIDHMPLAVRDLAAAAATYARLGFAIKPGRRHANGIANQHVKFPDGAGIELVHAPDDSRDEQSAAYAHLLAEGEGPAFQGFRTPDLAGLQRRLASAGFPVRNSSGILTVLAPGCESFFFFEGDNRSPSDRPEHFRHPNGAHATIGMWLAVEPRATVPKLFQALGSDSSNETVYAPGKLTNAPVARMGNSSITFVPASSRILPNRPIIGLVLETASLAATRQVLRQSRIPIAAERRTESTRSLYIAPAQTHGLWLEFRSKFSHHPSQR